MKGVRSGSGLILRELGVGDEQAFLRGAREWPPEELSWYSFNWKPGMSFLELLERERKNSVGLELPEGFVPATMFYGFVNDEIVGRLNVRHRLNDFLLRRGGHIGYAVARRYRGKGYAREMLAQAIPKCRALGIDDILITCADENTVSWKVIERNGGVLENRVYDDVDQEMIRRYWIKTRTAPAPR